MVLWYNISMSAERFEHFKQVCAEAGITIRPDIADAGDGKRRIFGGYSIGYYGALLVANAYVAKVTREDNGRDMTDGQIPEEHLEGDVASIALARTLNSALVPEKQRAQTYPLSDRPIQACPNFEDYIDMTIKREGQNTWGFQVFISPDGTPLFLRKGYNRPLALSLLPTDADGIEFMPGTVFNIEAEGDRYTGLPYEASVPRNEVTALPASSINSLSPLRLSAFALPMDQRAEHFGYGIEDVTTLTVRDISESVIDMLDRGVIAEPLSV
jgi:hypothetical protein